MSSPAQSPGAPGEPPVVVIGAGITGMTMAYLLLKQGVPVRIFEASEDTGGLGATFQRDGFAFDYGPHEFCTHNPNLIALLEEVGGQDLLTIEKRTAQYFRGRFVHFPFTPADVMRAFGPLTFTRASVELLWAGLSKSWRRDQAKTFEDWTCAHMGRTLYDNYFGPYTEKVWGVPPNQLDLATARDRIASGSVFDLLKKSFHYRFLGGARQRSTHDAYHQTFRYFRGGMGTLGKHLLERVEALGGRVECGMRLQRLSRAGDRVSALHFENGEVLKDPAHVVSSMPLPSLAQMALGDAAEGRADLPFRGMAFVHLRIAKEEVMPYHWVYFPDAQFPFQRTTEFSQFEAGMAPPGQTALTCEVASNPGQLHWDLDDGKLVELCIQGLRELGVLEPKDVLGVDVLRVPQAYPLQVVGYADRVAGLLDSLAPLSNLVTLGRQGLFRYCNMDECMEMAMQLAPQIQQGRLGLRYDSPPTWQGVGLTDA